MPIEQISVKDKQELEKIVTEEINAVENGLTVLYNNIRIDPKTNLDILCRDADGRLVVMQIDTTENDNMFFEGLRCLNYVDTVKPMLKAAYGKGEIDETASPRLILLASAFSSNLRNVVENTNVIEVDLYQWDYLQIDDKKGLYAHPVFVKKARVRATTREEESKQTKRAVEKKARPSSIPPMPEKENEELEAELFEPAETVIPPKEITSTSTEQKKEEKEKRKSIFSL